MRRLRPSDYDGTHRHARAFAHARRRQAVEPLWSHHPPLFVMVNRIFSSGNLVLVRPCWSVRMQRWIYNPQVVPLSYVRSCAAAAGYGATSVPPSASVCHGQQNIFVWQPGPRAAVRMQTWIYNPQVVPLSYVALARRRQAVEPLCSHRPFVMVNRMVPDRTYGFRRRGV